MKMPSLNVWVYLAIAALLIGAAGGAYWYIYEQGAASEKAEQERKLNTLKEKTHETQNNALTAPDPNERLRKYERKD